MLTFSQLQFGHTPRHAAIYTPPLDCSIACGQFVALLGRNGTGKSSLLQTIARLLPPLQGVIYWDNQDIHRLPPAIAALQIAWVTAAARSSDLDFMSVRDMVAMGRYPHTGWWGSLTARDHLQIDWALDTLGITPALSLRPFNHCSDGERQLASLARALAQDTPILLLDEATAHLDLIHRQTVFQHLRHIAHQYNKIILLATHELDLATQWAHTALILSPPHWSLLDAAIGVAHLKTQR